MNTLLASVGDLVRNDLSTKKLGQRPVVLVGTHHKTGTVWLKKMMARAARFCGRKYIDISPTRMDAAAAERVILAEVEAGRPSILVDHRSRFPTTVPTDRCRGFHIVRDPRDVLVSATKYHCESREKWLHKPKENLAGKTYQEMINSFPTMAEKQMFEVTHTTKSTLSRMLNFEDGNVFRTYRYEDLIADRELLLWHEVAVYLGFQGPELVWFLRAVWGTSLFGSFRPNAVTKKHIQSGGETQRWRKELAPEVLAFMEERYQKDWQRLGYR